MNQANAIEKVISDANSKGEFLATKEVIARASLLLESFNTQLKSIKGYDSLGSKNAGPRRMKAINALPESIACVIREIAWCNAAEFLGDEFWLSLPNRESKLIAATVYNTLKGKILNRM